MATLKYTEFGDDDYEHDTNDNDMKDFLSNLSYDELKEIMSFKLTKDDLIEALAELYGLTFNDLKNSKFSVSVKDYYEQEAKDAYEQEQYERRDPYGARGLCERDFN